ncbi:MAG: tRNA 2-selenouridine(34) synthase MnmH [Pseudomonadales bacterium]
MTNRARDNVGSESFQQLFLQDIPLLDVRAPIEFAAGAFPSALNLPLLDDEQRHAIGTAYALSGQQAAIDLGVRMASPEVRAQRLQRWRAFTEQNPEGYLYCFRGGLRSQTTQRWLQEAGCEYPLVIGGYKALRRYLLDELERLCEKGNVILLLGATGVGKTELIDAHPSSIDLEGRAKHRGSAFGKTFVEQPAQINWENQIIIDWLKCEANSDSPVLIEAESRSIGRINVSASLQQAMSRAPGVVLQASLQERIERLRNDYVLYSLRHFQQAKENPWAALQANVLENLSRIQKRLGGLRYNELCQILPDAVAALRDHDDWSGFDSIIATLLSDYYDKLYQYQLNKNQASVVFRGGMFEVKQWIDEERQ